MKAALIYLLLVVGGLFLGVATLPVGALLVENISVEGWRSNWSIGLKQTNPYTRAYVSVFGLLGLPKSEAVYFTRGYDDDGELLHGDCVYEMTGTAQAGQWWSITLYDRWGYLPINNGQALSVDATGLGNSPDTSWRTVISDKRPDDGAVWLSADAVDNFELTLRIYKPSAALLADPKQAFNPPSLKRKSCTGE